MSYNKTVTCSHCWNSGHNKAGCSVLKKKMQERLANDPNDWYAKDYFERKERSKRRSCSYCKEDGHTKRTCVHIKDDKAKTVKLNKLWRQDALDYFKNVGLGVGALVQFRSKNSWDEDKVQNVLITEILWSNLTFLVKDGSARPYSFRVRPLENFSQTRYMDFPVDPAGVVSPCTDHGLHAKVLAPVSSDLIELNMPDSWLSGCGEEIDKLFLDSKGNTKPRYHVDWIGK